MPVILYDGWSLVHEPNSPAALHLLTLLAYHPPDMQAVLALPYRPPAWLPLQAELHLHPAPATGLGRLQWEQWILPRVARERKAGLIHWVAGNPALFTSTPGVFSPAGFGAAPLSLREDRRAGLAARLREALGQGGLARVQKVCWPADLPVPGTDIPVLSLPPVVHPAFCANSANVSQPLSELDLPETYVLYHGPGSPPALQRLLQAWSWAAGSIGDYYPLLLLGLEEAARQTLSVLSAAYGLEDTVRPMPALAPQALAAVYLGCQALFHPAPISPWGSSVRFALACGKPVVGFEDPLSDALVGPAAYLVSSQGEAGSRALGAALITVIVEEEITAALSQAARQRSSSWHPSAFSDRLREVYHSLLSG